MYTRRAIRFSIVARFGWASFLFFLVYSTGVVLLHRTLPDVSLGIPIAPLSVFGIAVAFYLGFKNNSSYDRLWEARRIWGALVNSSRTWAVQVLHFIEADRDAARELIYRHLAFLTALRVQLRRPTPWEQGYKAGQKMASSPAFRTESLEKELGRFIPDAEAARFALARNAATQLLAVQNERLLELYRAGNLTVFHQLELSRTVAELYNQQGAAERIKTFPFPRQYAHFSFLFSWLFILILPFGLLNEFEKLGPAAVWLVVPFHTLLAFVFNTMEIVGATSENPFENGINDVPITAICRTIEIDLRELLGETDLPPKLEPVNHILM